MYSAARHEAGAGMTIQGHVLIVDDEASLRHTLARVLQRAGLEVTTAASGREALDYLARLSLDLVYLDIRMPEMSGLKVLQVVHSKYPELPVVLFTAQPDLSSAVAALREGAADYLLKPLEPKAFIQRTQAILEQRVKEHRRREIQAQIESLQEELKDLDSNVAEPIVGASSQSEPNDRYLSRGKFTFDLHTHRIWIDQRLVDLPPTAFDYLLVLARHAPNVVDYGTLVAEAQGYQADMREAQELAKWHVHHIRQAIETDTRNPCVLINVRGTGYRLVLD